MGQCLEQKNQNGDKIENMTDIIKEMNLKTIKAAAKNVQLHVEEFRTDGMSKSKAEAYVAGAGKKLMTPIVNLALQNKVPGDEILQAIHDGSEEARNQKDN